MSGRWFDSSRQIFWDNNQQDLTIPGALQTSTANISSIVGGGATFNSVYAPELNTATRGGDPFAIDLAPVSSIPPGYNWQSVAMNESGQYQSGIILGGNIWISSDYGVTWVASPGSPSTTWTSISISASGQYQTAVTYTSIYISADYGATWTQTNTSAGSKIYLGVSLSASGQYQTAVATNGSFVYVSSNYGATWTQLLSAHDWNSVAISSTGQYQTAIGQDGSAYRSNNYGVTWTSIVPSITQTAYWRVSMSATGQYQAVVTYLSTDRIYISNDYGITWNPTGPTDDWIDVLVSASGQIMLAYAYYTDYFWISNDYGSTWNTDTIIYGYQLKGMALSASNEYFTVAYGGTGFGDNNIYTSISRTKYFYLSSIEGGTAIISSITGDSLIISSINSLTANIDALTTSSIVINNINNSTAQISSLTAVNISSLQGQIGQLTTSSIVSNNVSSFTAQISSIRALNISTVQGTVNGLTTSSIVSNNVSSFTGQISSLITLNFSTVQGTVNGLTTSSIVSNNLSSQTGQISSLITLNFSTVQGTVNGLTTSSIVSNNLSSQTGQISSLIALNMSSLRGQVGALTTSSIVSNNLSSQTGQISSLITLNVSSLRGQMGSILTSSIGINCNAPRFLLDVNGSTNLNGSVNMSNLPVNNVLITSAQQQILLSNAGVIMYMQSATNRIRIGAYSNTTGMPFTINESGGNVGINCNASQYQLDVNGATNVNGNISLGGVTIPTLPSGYKAFGLTGGNSYGYMYGAFQSLGDGIHLSYNYINCNLGNTVGYIPNTGLATSQIDMQQGGIGFSIGAANTAPTTRMYLNATGLGIGTTSPTLPLHVATTVSYAVPAGWQMWSAGTGGFGGITEGVSIYGAGDIWSANRMVVSSDERIKQDIIPLSLDSTIQLLQKITPVSYTYKDILKSKQVHVGFIAQAVEDICPNAVSHSTEYIPNINKIVSTITTDSTVTTYLEIDSTFLNSSIQFYTPDSTKIQGKIVSISSNSFDTLMDATLPNYSTLLCKGVSVDDFRVLDKDYIFTLNVAATKKLMELVEQQGSTIQGIQLQLLQKR